MKAIYCSMTSPSGDHSYDAIATFDDEQTDLMNTRLEELQEDTRDNMSVSFEINDYAGCIPHNPKTFEEIAGRKHRNAPIEPSEGW